jgi:hypothetical protein
MAIPLWIGRFTTTHRMPPSVNNVWANLFRTRGTIDPDHRSLYRKANGPFRGRHSTMFPAYYRARAATIRRLAEDVEDPLERARFFDFAAEYDKLASYAERVRRKHPAHAYPPRKVDSAVTR